MKTINNHVQLIGNLGQDPKMTTFKDGSSICRFSLATNEYYKDKEGEKQSKTDWHNVVAWGKKAEVMAEMLQKGQQVVIQGKLRNRSYEDSNGDKKYITEIVTDEFLLVGNKKEAINAVAEEQLPF